MHTTELHMQIMLNGILKSNQVGWRKKPKETFLYSVWLREEKCATMPTDLNICLYCSARVTQLPGVKSGCTIYCGLQSVACGFPVFVMLETEQKGVSRLWSLTHSKISRKRVNLNVPSFGCILPPSFFFFFAVHQKCQAHAEITLTSLLD